MIARKLDSNFTITKRMIRRETRKAISEAVPQTRNASFVRNYVFSGVGSGGFGTAGRDGGLSDTTTGDVFDPVNPGTQYTQTRGKIQAAHGAYLQDAPSEDAIRIVADAVNDPMYWLGVGI